MKEEQFIELPSQGSIYSVGRLGNNVIVGSGDHGKVFSFSVKGGGNLEEVSLPDLPQDIEVIAVDAFMDPCPVLAVTFVQKSGGDPTEKNKASLHIYSTWTEPDSPTASTASNTSSPEGSKSNSPKGSVKEDSSYLELIGQHSKTFKLDYIPYDLCHVPVRRDKDSYENIFLLSGSDKLIHAFQGDTHKSTFTEVDVEKYFPEISKAFDSLVTRVQVESINDAVRRISMCGCEDGTLHIWMVTSPLRLRKSVSPQGEEKDQEDEIVEKIEHHFEGMITSMQFFTDGFQFNAVVSSACSPVFIYTNTIEDRFAKGVPLKFSSRWDTVEAVCVADIDLDGKAEIIVGTFGCTMLVYKYLDDVIPQWVIVAHKKFLSGILSIEFLHNYSLLVVTANGIHVIEYCTSAYFHKHTNIMSGTIPEESTIESTDSLTFKSDQD